MPWIKLWHFVTSIQLCLSIILCTVAVSALYQVYEWIKLTFWLDWFTFYSLPTQSLCAPEYDTRKFELLTSIFFKTLLISQKRYWQLTVKFHRQDNAMHIYRLISSYQLVDVVCSRELSEKPPKKRPIGVVSKMASHPRKSNAIGISR
jgi:hypothetical protein